ncbi:MAG: ribose-phosphate pyrophosphokinase [Tissierellia bacterium]|nr:ribose-phosphate pyrophosphokinase [Tissierellia bacterium]
MATKEGDLKVISGNSSPEFAKKVCDHLKIRESVCDVNHFSDGEINVNIKETVRGSDVFVIQPTCSPVNDNLMELLIIIDALKRASAGRVNAVIPYYGYARQDRKTKAREPITAKLIADLITAAGADRVVTMDLHAGQIQGFFDIPLDHLTAGHRLSEYFEPIVEKDPECVIVSPDLGGVTRARNFANHLNLPIAIIEKRRPKPNVSEVMNIIGDIKGKRAVLIDDIIDTGGTMVKAAETLKAKGAKAVYACATHGVLSGEAVERIENSEIEEFIITDTIPLPKEKSDGKIKVVSVSDLFATAVKRIHYNESISVVFD